MTHLTLRLRRHFGLLLLVSCGDDAAGNDASATTGSGMTGSHVTTDTTGTTSGTSTEGTQGETSTTGEYCGNGLVEPPEECDDGNAVDDDGCDGDCTITHKVSLRWENVQSKLASMEVQAVDISSTGRVVVGINGRPTNSLDLQRVIVAISDGGDTLWSRIENGPEPDSLGAYADNVSKVIALDSGGFAVCGSEYTGLGSSRTWVAVYSGDGELSWESKQTLAPGDYNYCTSISSTSTQDIVAVGYYHALDDLGWMGGFSSTGTNLWQMDPVNVLDGQSSILSIEDDGGDLLVVARFELPGLFVFSSKGEYQDLIDDGSVWRLIGRTTEGFAALRRDGDSYWWSHMDASSGQLSAISNFQIPKLESLYDNVATDGYANAYVIRDAALSKYSASGTLLWTSEIAPTTAGFDRVRLAMNLDGTQLVISGDRMVDSGRRVYTRCYQIGE